MNVLVADMTHGGPILAEKYLERGDTVTIADIYHTGRTDIVEELRGKGIRVLDACPDEEFDLIVSPSHCPDSLIGPAVSSSRISFSDAVNSFDAKKLFRIEITGVKGKTSTAYFLAHVLDSWGKKVFLHTSRGQGPYSKGVHSIESIKSIAPPSILELPDEGYDYVISEVSLGGSGKANVAVVTNLLEDYDIAAGTRKASDAKKSVFCRNVNIIRADEAAFWNAVAPDTQFVCFSDNCRIEERMVPGEPAVIRYTYSNRTFQVESGKEYLQAQYLKAFDAVLKICEILGVNPGAVEKAMRTFAGVPGRGSVTRTANGLEITERNPGVSALSIRETIRILRSADILDRCFFIVEPANTKVCEKMDMDRISEELKSSGADYLIMNGRHSDAKPTGYEIMVRFVKEGWV